MADVCTSTKFGCFARSSSIAAIIIVILVVIALIAIALLIKKKGISIKKILNELFITQITQFVSDYNKLTRFYHTFCFVNLYKKK